MQRLTLCGALAAAALMRKGGAITTKHLPKRAVCIPLVLMTVVVMAWALPAQAEVIEQQHYAFSFSEDFELCGIPVHEEAEVSGTVHLRVGKGDLDSAFFTHDNYESTSTITNPANGKFFVIERNALFHETVGTRIEGTIFQFTSVEAGQPFVLRDMSGDIVLRDRGVIRSTILFDTLGDETPGGEFLALLDEQVAGPHPGRLDEAAFCAIVQDLIG
jgi:hypothetical protein